MKMPKTDVKNPPYVYMETVNILDMHFTIVASDQGLIFIGGPKMTVAQVKEFVEQQAGTVMWKGQQVLTQKAITQLDEYWRGERKIFTVPLDLNFLKPTPFQKQVWQGLMQVPYGEIQTYGQLAEAIGYSKKHARAVGTAVGRNPLLIVVPCHRILPAHGKGIGQFSSGVALKEKILKRENVI